MFVLLDVKCINVWNCFFLSAIEAQVRDLQNQRKQLNQENIPKPDERVGFADVGGYDDDIYTGSKSKFEGYHTSLAIDEADVSKANKNKSIYCDRL